MTNEPTDKTHDTAGQRAARDVDAPSREKADASQVDKDSNDQTNADQNDETGRTSGSDKPFAKVTRRQLKDALGENSELRPREMMRAIRQADTPEEALAALAEKAAERGERLAMTRVIPPTVTKARFRIRHFIAIVSFIFFVIVPTTAAYLYLTTRAAPQYASITAFSVRSEEHASPTELLSGAFGLSGSTTNDTDVLYDFLQSQELVTSIKAYRDFERLWSGPYGDWFSGDPVFAMKPGTTIEDQTKYWNRMVSTSYDTSAGILEVEVKAFTPEDAQLLAQDILNESTRMINELSSVARVDALRYAQEDLTAAEDSLRSAREALTQFRNQYQIASIDSDIALSTGPLNALTQLLVEAKIELGLLERDTTDSDPRVLRSRARIEVIEQEIANERAKLGTAVEGGEDALLSARIAEFERLSVDQEFAARTYETALSVFYAARADANRQALYLAAHKSPTLAEQSDYPAFWTVMGLVGGLTFAFWSIVLLTILSLRDRR